MTCKDCIYEPMCLSRISHGMGDDDATGELLTDIETRCKAFKSNAKVIEVVRCKGCANGVHNNGATVVCRVLGKVMMTEDYCSYGARKCGAE